MSKARRPTSVWIACRLGAGLLLPLLGCQPERREVIRLHEEAGDNFLKTEHWQEAADRYRRGLDENADWATGHIKFAYALNHVLRQGPTRPVDSATPPQASEFGHLSKVADALRSARTAIRLVPENGDSHFVLGWILATKRWDLSEAQASLGKASSLWQTNEDRILPPERTRTLLQASLAAVRNEIARGPNIVEASRHLRIAGLAAHRRRKEECFNACRKAVALAPRDDRVLVEVANRYWDLGDPDRCLETLESGLGKLPQSRRLHGALGFFLAPEFRFGKSEEHLLQALALPWAGGDAFSGFPTKLHCYFVLGVLGSFKGELQQTRDYMEKFIDLVASEAPLGDPSAAEWIEAARGRIQSVDAPALKDVLLKRVEFLELLLLRGAEALMQDHPARALEFCENGLVWIRPDMIEGPFERIADLKMGLWAFRCFAHLALNGVAEAERDAISAHEVARNRVAQLRRKASDPLSKGDLWEQWLAEVDAVRLEALCNEMLGRHAKAIRMLENAVQAAPDKISNFTLLMTYYNLARTSLEIHAVTNHALRACEAAEPTPALLGFLCGEVPESQLLTSAEQEAQQAKVPMVLVEACTVAGTSHYHAGRRDEAKRLWQQAIDTNFRLSLTYWLAKWKLTQLDSDARD